MELKNLNDLNQKKILKKLKLIVPAQQAKLGPPVGAILGQVKIKVKDFCAQFNDSTIKYKSGLPLPLVVFVFKGDTFSFFIKTPSISFLIKNISSLNTNNEITLADLYKICLIKRLDFKHIPERSLYRNILFQARALRVTIKIVL